MMIHLTGASHYRRINRHAGGKEHKKKDIKDSNTPWSREKRTRKKRNPLFPPSRLSKCGACVLKNSPKWT